MAVTHEVPDGTLPAQAGSALGLKNKTNRLLRGGSLLLGAVVLLPQAAARGSYAGCLKSKGSDGGCLGLAHLLPPWGSRQRRCGLVPAQPRAGLHRRPLSREQPGS